MLFSPLEKPPRPAESIKLCGVGWSYVASIPFLASSAHSPPFISSSRKVAGTCFHTALHLLVRRPKLRGHHVLDVGADFPAIDRPHVKAYFPQAADPIRFVRLHPAGRLVDRKMDTSELAEQAAALFAPSAQLVDPVVTRSLAIRPADDHSARPLFVWFTNRQPHAVSKRPGRGAHLVQLRQGGFYPPGR